MKIIETKKFFIFFLLYRTVFCIKRKKVDQMTPKTTCSLQDFLQAKICNLIKLFQYNSNQKSVTIFIPVGLIFHRNKYITDYINSLACKKTLSSSFNVSYFDIPDRNFNTLLTLPFPNPDVEK